jgi:hypothetical protein
MEANYSLKSLDISPSNGEKEVKKYVCTYLKSKIIRLQARGTIAVTNKRVIFRASGSSASGRSILQSETPLEDVSGINVYKGTYFNIKSLVLGIAIFTLSIIFWPTIINMLSFSTKNILLVESIIFAVASLLVLLKAPNDILPKAISGSIAFNSFKMIAYAPTEKSLLSETAIRSAFSEARVEDKQGNLEWVMIFAIVTLIITFIYLILSSRRETMSLAIGSKGGSSTPIYISGVSSWGISNNAAVKAIEAEPAEEAEVMIKELGALILDLQHMGDYGIEKWIDSSKNVPADKKYDKKGNSWICPKCNAKNDLGILSCKHCGEYK